MIIAVIQHKMTKKPSYKTLTGELKSFEFSKETGIFLIELEKKKIPTTPWDV